MGAPGSSGAARRRVEASAACAEFFTHTHHRTTVPEWLTFHLLA